MFKHLLAIACVALCQFMACAAQAAPLIRDAEIEYTLRRMGTPLFQANGLDPRAIHIFIVQDDTLNAYVAGGANLFLHTGMIMACTTPDMLLGVMAHETGHIAGGHLARGGEKLKDAQIGGIMTFVLGAAAAAATGRGEAAMAVISGGQGSVMRNFFSFTRSNEESADQSALRTLDKLGISASGMVETFALLKRNERGRANNIDPYMLTHPLTSTRITHVREHADKSSIPYGTYPAEDKEPHERMLAKLYGFLQTPERTLARYGKSDQSVAAHIARAVAYYKMPNLNAAMAELDPIINKRPDDPFLYDLKGQILFENNRPKEALAAYTEAARLLPNSPLILLELGRVELAQSPPLLTQAIAHLERSVNLQNDHAYAWRILAGAYEKAGKHGMRMLALAEEALLKDDPEMALKHIDPALEQLQQNTPTYQRAKDIKSFALLRQRQKEDDDQRR